MNKITIEEFVKRVNALQAGEHISVQLVEDGYIVTAFATLVKGNRYHFMMVEGFYGNCEQGFEVFDEQGVHEYIDYVKNLAVDTDELEEITELIVVEEKKQESKEFVDDFITVGELRKMLEYLSDSDFITVNQTLSGDAGCKRILCVEDSTAVGFWEIRI